MTNHDSQDKKNKRKHLSITTTKGSVACSRIGCGIRIVMMSLFLKKKHDLQQQNPGYPLSN